ncbi:MAG: hypothetical protein WCG47_21190 [Dermatophilaceae bacterium]
MSRPQLAVLQRQVARPRYTPSDRLVLAWLSRMLPRERWSVFLVRPATLLRWHSGTGRAPLDLPGHGRWAPRCRTASSTSRSSGNGSNPSTLDQLPQDQDPHRPNHHQRDHATRHRRTSRAEC